jgi:hypothetical protein
MLLRAEELFRITIDSNSVFPLNLSFELTEDSRPAFQGPGIYFLYYKAELIYIGFFYPSQKNRDVRKERMLKEIATITMRGNKVVFSKDAFNAHQQCVNYPIYQGEISANGFQTSKNRVEFADQNWSEFQNNEFLKDFSFYWFKEDKTLGRTRNELKEVTKQLFNFYKPTCNGKIFKN